jgi:hypothetical protein
MPAAFTPGAQRPWKRDRTIIIQYLSREAEVVQFPHNMPSEITMSGVLKFEKGFLKNGVPRQQFRRYPKTWSRNMDFATECLPEEQSDSARLAAGLMRNLLASGCELSIGAELAEKLKNASRSVDSDAKISFTLNFNADFEVCVREALQLTPKQRLARLAEAEKYPPIRIVETIVFERNPDVVAQKLHEANGKCQRCQKPAPFYRRNDQTPYLEVHHRQPLANGGEDTVENTIALCPNCHREMHFG